MKKGKLIKDKGFTLLEVIIVLGIMSLFLMLTIPAAGRLEQSRRVINTRERMQAIREAYLGQTPFDPQGRRQINGYTGDLGSLPQLYPSEWNVVQEVWSWPLAPEDESEFEHIFHMSRQEYLNLGLGQPRGLWNNAPVTGQPPLGVRWRGPYITEPVDELLENHVNLLWDPFAPDGTPQFHETREYEMRRTQGKLADAWGRSLLFFYADPLGNLSKRAQAHETIVHIVSEGADMRSTIPAYDRNLPHNDDNIVMTITPKEWTDETRPYKTRQILDSIKEAIKGSPKAQDSRGRGLTGGYTADMGEWPKPFVWVEDVYTAEWFWGESELVESQIAPGTFYREGVLRGLFTNEPGYDLNGHSIILPTPQNPVTGVNVPVPMGFGWRGPYLPEPEGFGGEQLIRDAWGTPLRFRFVYPNQAAQFAHTLVMTSAGADGIFDRDQISGVDYSEDNISIMLDRSFDVRENMILHGRLVNETGSDIIIGNDIGQTKVRFHSSPLLDESPIWPLGTTTSTIYGTPENIAIYSNRLDFDMSVDGGGFAGLRFIEVVMLEGAGVERRLSFSYVDLTDKAFFSPGSVSNDRVVLIIR